MRLEFFGRPNYIGEEYKMHLTYKDLRFTFDGVVKSFQSGSQIAIPIYRNNGIAWDERLERFASKTTVDGYTIYEFQYATISVPKIVAEDGELTFAIGYKTLGNVDECPPHLVGDESLLREAVDKVIDLPDSSYMLLPCVQRPCKRKDNVEAVTPKGVRVSLPLGYYADDFCLITGNKTSDDGTNFSRNWTSRTYMLIRKG